MARLLRSVYSDPVSAGIRAFGEVSDIIEKRETAPLRRELMASELAERRLRTERERETMEFERKKRAEWERILGRQHATEENIDLLKDLTGAQIEIDAAETEGREPRFTDKQRESIFKMFGKGQVFDPNKNIDEQVSGIQNIQKFMKENANQLQQGGRLDRDKYPDLFQSFDKIFEDQINRGSDRHGNTVEEHGVKKRVKSVFIDPRDQSLAFSLEVETPVKEGQVFKHIGETTPIFTINANAQGMIEQGNIDLSKRPVVRNADGSISTVLSASFWFPEEKKEVLLPMISDSGKRLTAEEAKAEYYKTGKHLGKFDSPEAANAYAEQLHADPMWSEDIKQYSAKGQTSTKYDAPITFDRSGTDPNARVVKVPIGIFDRYLSSHASLGSMIQQLRAQLKPEEFASQMEKTKKLRAQNVAISKAMGKVDTSKGVDEQRKQFITEFTKLYPEASVKDTADLAKVLIVEREPLLSPIGKLQADRARLINQGYGSDSPEVKQIDAAIGKATKEPEIPSAIKEFEEVEKMPETKKKAFYKHRELMKERPKGEEKPLSVSEQRQLRTEAFGRFSKLLPEELFEKEEIIKRKNLDELITNLPNEVQSKARDMIDRVTELKQENPKLTWNQAFNQAEKELGTIEKPLKPITQGVIDEIKKEINKMKDKPKTPKDAEALADIKARERGYDPTIKARE